MSSESTQEPGIIGWLAGNRNQGGLALMIAGIALAAAPVTLVALYQNQWMGVVVLTAALALLWLFTGVWLRFRSPSAGSPADEARMVVLGLGGLTGLCVAILGLILNIQWWGDLSRWLRLGERDGAWRVLIAVATLIGGLALMFWSLSAARSEERSSPVLRRLIYGYNAVLGGLLLFMILAVINVLAYLKLPNMVDSTEAGIFSLSDRSKQVLRSLDKPLTVYLIMSTQSEAYDEMRTFLGNAQEYAPTMHVESVSTGLNTAKVLELKREFPELAGEGVLLVYGEDKERRSSFIRNRDVMKMKSVGTEEVLSFEGESAFVKELSFLSENKQKPIVYFAHQNAGEFDYNDSDPRKKTGIGMLVARLGRKNFDVRPLKFETADPKVPDDATIVVLPGPRLPYPQPIVNALQKYLADRKGKLVVLVDTPADRRASTMPETGLEGLLASYRVELAKERILMLPVQVAQSVIENPENVLSMVADAAVNAKNPVATAFKDYPFVFEMPRIVRPMTGGPELGARAEVLVETYPSAPVWAEADLGTSPFQMVEGLLKNPTLRAQKLSKTPLPMAVTVTEAPPQGSDPSAAPKPRVVVFGVANFITNPRVDEGRANPAYFDLFAGTLDWLREKPAGIGVEPRTYKNFALDPRTDGVRLLFLPLVLAIVGIIGLGAGVWIARRR